MSPLRACFTRRRRHGSSLLEIMVAIVILGAVGVGSVVSLLEALHALERSTESDEQFQSALRLLDAAALWSNEDLNRRLGSRRQGPWSMRIERPEAALYSIAVLDSLEHAVIVRTMTWRPE